MQPKRLLVLGAGHFQLPGIQRAVALGYHVITADYLPDNIGHRVAHESVNVSTTDPEGVLAVARRLRIDGITTFCSDVAMPSIGAVCDALGLPGPSRAVAETLAHKDRFRALQRVAGLPHPPFVTGTRFDEIDAVLRALPFPVVCKPVDTSGSRGVTRVETPDPVACRRAFDIAASFSPTGRVCVESFLDGVEVGGDAFLIDGELAVCVITRKLKRGFVVTGHALPTDLDPAGQARVMTALRECCRAVGYHTGPLNFDVMVLPDRVVVLEMSARNGGNGITELIERATGCDLWSMIIRAAVGDPVAAPTPCSVMHPCGSLILGSPTDGIIDAIADDDALRATVPSLFRVHRLAERGDAVHAFTHSGQMLGYVLFDIPDGATYATMAARIDDALGLRVVAPVPVKGSAA